MARPDSNEEKRPSPWNLFDALTFGGAAALMTCAAVYTQVNGISSGPKSGYALIWLVAVLSWGVYLLLVRDRQKFIQSYDLVLSNGIMVKTNGYKAARWDFEFELSRVIEQWTPHFPRSSALLTQDRVWVSFDDKLLTVPESRAGKAPRTFAGLTSMGGSGIRLTYFGNPDTPLTATAFAHELGHVILGRATNAWDNDEHHTFMRDRHLP